MRVVDHAGLGPARHAEIARLAAAFGSLQDVVRWAFSLSPPRSIAEVVVQDEFTHDVVIEWLPGLVLAFDTT